MDRTRVTRDVNVASNNWITGPYATPRALKDAGTSHGLIVIAEGGAAYPESARHLRCRKRIAERHRVRYSSRAALSKSMIEGRVAARHQGRGIVTDRRPTKDWQGVSDDLARGVWRFDECMKLT